MQKMNLIDKILIKWIYDIVIDASSVGHIYNCKVLFEWVSGFKGINFILHFQFFQYTTV